jgi:CRP-like cAMP-binding protein
MDIVEFVKSYPVRKFSKGEMLYAADVTTDAVMIIREGIVKVVAFSDEGNERLLWLAGRYDIVPTEQIIKSVTTPRFYYTAYSDGSAYEVKKKELLREATRHNEIMAQIARGLGEHHDDLLRHIDGIEQPNLRSKILYLLHTLCLKFSGSDVVALHEIGLKLTHQDIADMVHASREAVSIEMKQLQVEGYVEYTRSSFIVRAHKIATTIE